MCEIVDVMRLHSPTCCGLGTGRFWGALRNQTPDGASLSLSAESSCCAAVPLEGACTRFFNSHTQQIKLVGPKT